MLGIMLEQKWAKKFSGIPENKIDPGNSRQFPGTGTLTSSREFSGMSDINLTVTKQIFKELTQFTSSNKAMNDARFEYNTMQYKFYCQLPMGAFQRQILIVQVIKKLNR